MNVSGISERDSIKSSAKGLNFDDFEFLEKVQEQDDEDTARLSEEDSIQKQGT